MNVEPSLSVLTYNLHLFGSTALYPQGGTTQETGFYFRDDERLPQIIDGLRRTEADVVGLTEVWDDGMRVEIERSLKDLYPYSVASPAAAGIGRAIGDFQENWPKLAEVLFRREGGVVNYFTRHHYKSLGPCRWLSGLKAYLSEDYFVRGLSRLIRSLPVWGAGLLFLSRHPIVGAQFHPHEEKADWELLAGKGVLDATVQADFGAEFQFSLGHYQEGLSDKATATRNRQIRRARSRTDGVSSPLVYLGDFNVPGSTRDYEVLSRTMGLSDVAAGDTYLEPNPYQDKLQAPRPQHTSGQRIDYIFHSSDLLLHSAKILRETFRSRNKDYDLSDHFPLLARLLYRPAESGW